MHKNSLLSLAICLVATTFLFSCSFNMKPQKEVGNLKHKSISRKIDDFKVEKASVETFFYDPGINAKIVYPELSYAQKSDAEKSDLWSKYLHAHAIYLFKVTLENGEVLYYCVRGDESKQETAFFYKIEMITGINVSGFDPNKEDYDSNITKTYGSKFIRGELFEYMEIVQPLIKSKKINPGDGVTLFSFINRVASYQEAKNEIIEIIQENLPKKSHNFGIFKPLSKPSNIKPSNYQPTIHRIKITCC